MEIRFDNIEIPCLQPVVKQTQSMEQTQEIRIDDGMPDIGRVIGTWGQVVLRGKEWHTGQLGVSGGIMLWVLYESEDGNKLQNIESWMPFQAKWEFADRGREGKMINNCVLRSIDARSVSARKLMVRAELAVSCEGVIPVGIEFPIPGETPSDVFLKKEKYPLRMAVEAGEKMFTVDEALPLPVSAQEIDRLIRYELKTELVDQKIVTDKVVFRGMAQLRVLYLSPDGELCTYDNEIPFSQYTELDKEYTDSASAAFCFMVTNLELDKKEDGGVHLSAGITAQYTVTDRIYLESIEDAYSVKRNATVMLKQTDIPIILDVQQKEVELAVSSELPCRQIADVSWCFSQTAIKRNKDCAEAEVTGTARIIYYDPEGILHSHTETLTKTCAFLTEENVEMATEAISNTKPAAVITQSGLQLHADVMLSVSFSRNTGFTAAEGIVLEETSERNVTSPSLILRRAGNDCLWNIAKTCGSSVDEIMKVNSLQEQPGRDRMLLVPILR